MHHPHETLLHQTAESSSNPLSHVLGSDSARWLFAIIIAGVVTLAASRTIFADPERGTAVDTPSADRASATEAEADADSGPDSADPDAEPALVVGKPHAAQWMTGSAFSGVLHHDGGRGPVWVQVTGFHGDRVTAFTRSRGAIWRRQTLPARALVGLEWLEYRCDIASHCPALLHRIVGARQDDSQNTMPAHSDNRDIWLYRVQSKPLGARPSISWQNGCSSTKGEPGWGMFVDGQWRSDGSWSATGYTFTCTNGVIAKCARAWGYKPWRTLVARDGRAVPLRPLHLACVRAARADYCGNGISYTRNGTLILIHDVHGFNVPPYIETGSEEAGFDEHGALFVRRERWATGVPDTDTETRLPTCRRSRSLLDRESERVLISVWSADRDR